MPISSGALTQSCDMLVNPDGSLSDQGQHAMHCIRNGALLGSGAKLIGIPTGIILGGLRMLAGPTDAITLLTRTH